MSYRRTVTCRHCWKTGHNKRGCPDYKKAAAEGNISEWDKLKPRRCSYCGKVGHDRRTCDELHKDKVSTILCNRKWVELVLKDLESCGVGVGSLLRLRQDAYSDNAGFFLAMVTGFKWENLFYKHPTKAWVKVKTFYGNFRKSYYYDEGSISFGDEHCPVFSEESDSSRPNVWNKMTLRGSACESKKIEVVSAHASSKELFKAVPAEILNGGGNGATDWFQGRQSANYYENGGGQ